MTVVSTAVELQTLTRVLPCLQQKTPVCHIKLPRQPPTLPIVDLLSQPPAVVHTRLLDNVVSSDPGIVNLIISHKGHTPEVQVIPAF